MTTQQRKKNDPIRTKYFYPLERAERATDFAFYGAAVLSIAVLLVDRKQAPQLYAFAQIAFLVTAIAGFFLSMAVRVYFSPRAEDMRLADFLSNAFGVRLIPERTEHYYNTEADEAIRKIGAQVLENALFTKEIARRMCLGVRSITAAYLTLWLLAVFNRKTGFDLMVIASQIVFSEQLVSRAVRLEWLRGRAEAAFAALYQTLQMGQHDEAQRVGFTARILQELVKYENTKSNAAVTLSSRIFEKLNPSISADWARIKADLSL